MFRLVFGGALLGAVLLIGAALFAPNSSAAPLDTSNAAAQASCEGITRLVAVHGRVDMLAGAFNTTAADFVAWQQTRYGPIPADGPQVAGSVSMWTRMPATEPLTVCFFDGHFTNGFSRPRGAKVPDYDRIVMVIDETGQATLETAGYRATTRAEKPVRKP
jgi:hypothetical protein